MATDYDYYYYYYYYYRLAQVVLIIPPQLQEGPAAPPHTPPHRLKRSLLPISLPLACVAPRRRRRLRSKGPGEQPPAKRAKHNACRDRRRDSLRTFKALLTEVGVTEETLTLDVRNPCTTASLEKASRLLDARCAEQSQQQRLQAAVQQWVDNGGSLPEGVSLQPGTGLWSTATSVGKILEGIWRLGASAHFCRIFSHQFLLIL